MKHILSGLLGVCLMVAGAYVMFNHFFVSQSEQDLIPERVQIGGTYVCLPFRFEYEQTNTDCAAGIYTDTGMYYAVDFGLLSEGMPQLVEGDQFSAEGIVTPVSALGTDYWNRYEVAGIFSITDSFERSVVPEMILTARFTEIEGCAFCVGAAIELNLFAPQDTASSGTYTLEKRTHNQLSAEVETGKWERTMAEEDSIITLINADTLEVRTRYKVISSSTLHFINDDDVPDFLDAASDAQARVPLLGTWRLSELELLSGTVITPDQPHEFVIQFNVDGTFTSTTDCNRLGGSYVQSGEVLSFSEMISTKMFCPDSQEGEYANALLLTTSFTVDGSELQLHRNRDYGLMTFVRGE